MSDQTTIRQLRDEVEILKEALLTLKKTFREEGWIAHPNLQLSLYEIEFCRLLLKRKSVSHEQVLSFVFVDGGSPESVRHLVNRLRKKLRHYGVEIENVWAYGYALTPAHCDSLMSLDHLSKIERLGPNKRNRVGVPRNKKSSSGIRGVYPHASSHRWMAQIYSNGRQKYLGLFETKEEAAEVRRQAEDEKSMESFHKFLGV